VLTGVCVFVIIMSGVKVVSSHGDRPQAFSRMRALARSRGQVPASRKARAVKLPVTDKNCQGSHGSSARRVNLMRAPRRCMGGTRREPAYGGVCR
jgi:hypothetical protein